MPRDGRVALDNRTQRAHRSEWERRERRLAALAEQQHGVVEIGQLRALGFTQASVNRRVRAGRLHPIHRGVYAFGRPDVPLKGHWMAAVLACGQWALLSHRSAAALHDLLRDGRGWVDVTIAGRGNRSRSGIRIHRSTCLAIVDRTESEGIPCTSVARTLLDLAASVPRGVLEYACNQAEIERVLDMRAIDELLKRRAGQAGVARLRAALGIAHQVEGIPRTELERRFLGLCRRAGIPQPSVNEWMAIAGEEWQCDFVWHGPRVIVEVDGWETHQTWQAFKNDRRRDRVLTSHGWEPLRFTWHDVTGDPGHVEAIVLSVLRTAGDRREASSTR